MESSEKKLEDFDGILTIIGSKGRYQQWLLYVITAPITALVAFVGFTSIFTLYTPPHWCRSEMEEDFRLGAEPWDHGGKSGRPKCQPISSSNVTSNSDTCPNGWVYDQSDFTATIVTDYNWVCGKDAYSTNVFLAASLGNILGTLIYGRLIDKIGRKPVYFMAVLQYLLFMCISFFIPMYYPIYLGVMFLSGFGYSPAFFIPPMIMAELCDNEFRSWAYVVEWIAWVIGMAAIPIVAYGTGTWFLFGLSATLPGFIIFLFCPFLPESPRWLLSEGRVQEAKIIILEIAKKNGTSHLLCPARLDTILREISINHDRDVRNGPKPTIASLFRKKNLAKNTVLLTISWTVNTMAYNQTTLNTPYLSGNQFINFFLLAIIEIPSALIGGYLMRTLGRRWTPVIFFTISAICGTMAALLDPQFTNVILGCVILAKLAISSSFLIVTVQSAELFPTPLRGTGSGLASTVASILDLCSPYIVYMRKYHAGAPFIALAIMSIFGMTSSALLPETHKKHLPETLEQANNFGLTNKLLPIHDQESKCEEDLKLKQSEINPALVT